VFLNASDLLALYQRDTTGTPVTTTITSVPVTMYGDMNANVSHVYADVTINMPQIIYQEVGTGDIYYVGSEPYHGAPFDPTHAVSVLREPLLIQAGAADRAWMRVSTETFEGPDLYSSRTGITIGAGDILSYHHLDHNSYLTPPLLLTASFQLGALAVLTTISSIYASYYETRVFYQSIGLMMTGPVLTLPRPSAQYRIRDGIPLIKSDSIVAGDYNTVQLPSGITSSTDDFYTGSFLWIYNRTVFPVPTPFYQLNDYRQIVAYDGATHTATIAPAFSQDVSSAAPVTWELLQFDHENFSPLDVCASSVDAQQMVCYDIELVSLLLPNLDLAVARGNSISFYRYVLVEFYNQTAHVRGSIYSNNPAVNKCIFYVPIINTIPPTSAPYVPLAGVCTARIKFKPYDNFRFAVYMENGELFETVEQDTAPPLPPNPAVQVSVAFRLQRVG
jgi:hypothetical protein